MTTSRQTSWTARLAWAVLLLLLGAGIATWGLARWQAGARFLGVAPAPTPAAIPARAASPPATPVALVAAPADAARLATLEARLASIEQQTQSVRGSAGRADALLVAFAARRAIERGVALGYLEPLLVERFGAQHQRAVATIVTAARAPVTQGELLAGFDRLGPLLRGTAPDESWWTGVRREMGSLVSIRRNDTPSPRPAARYDRARDHLAAGDIDAAFVEVMRLPGASRPEVRGWIGAARRLILARRALDQIESAALLGPAAVPVGA